MKPTRHARRWSLRERTFLHQNAGVMPPEEIATVLNRSRGSIMSRAFVERISIPRVWRQGAKLTPPDAIWLAAASRAAQEAALPLPGVLGGTRKMPFVRARIAAWRAVLEAHPQYSVAGLARISGFDHSTLVHHGVRRVER